jgi:2-oxoisovalerate dehydrogenase E1 component
METVRRLLEDHEILCDLVIPTLLSPLPAKDILSLLGEVRKVAVLEEGCARGGWGAEVVATLAEQSPGRQRHFLRMGAPSSPIPSSKNLEKDLLPDVESVLKMLVGFQS